jgi:UDP-N-acetylmuramate--alanine ligase
MLGKTKKIHFIGIGGIGMSGIAEFLYNQGLEISGSDLKKTDVTRHLESLGIRIEEGHNPTLVKDVDVVVKSSAVKDDNPEIQAAKAMRIPVIRRAEMLAEITRMSFSIGISGTHGKTTTTSMTGLVLEAAGLDPTIIVGGKVKNYGSNNVMGSGKYSVVAAAEYAIPSSPSPPASPASPTSTPITWIATAIWRISKALSSNTLTRCHFSAV